MSYLLFLYISLLAVNPGFVLDYKEVANQTEAGAEFNVKKAKERELKRLSDPATGKMPNNIRNKVLNYVKTLPKSGDFKNDKQDNIQSNKWINRGPYNVGGRTRALALDVKSENVILAGGVSGGMWKTSDGGKTWYKTTGNDQLHSVSTIAQDTRKGKENIWYYGTGEIWGNSAHINGDGLFKSTDNGETWSQLDATSTQTPNTFDQPFEYVWRVITNHTNLNQDEVYAATAIGAIYRSSDGGKSWKNVLGAFGNDYSLFTELAITPKGVIYATMSEMAAGSRSSLVKGIYRSLDGINWVNITPANFPPKYKRIAIGISPSDENQVYFLAETPGYGKWTTNSQRHDLWHSLYKYTYISGDGSGTNGNWDDRTQSLPKPETVRHQMNSQGSYNLYIKVSPENSDIVYLGAVNLYRSTDGFRTDKNTSIIGGTCPDESCYYFFRYENHHADQHELVFSPSNPKILYTGSDGGVHKTLDAMANKVDWISLNNGYYTTQFYSIAIDHAVNNSPVLIGGLQDNGTLLANTDNLMHEWTSPTHGDGFWCQVPDSAKFYYTSINSSYQPMVALYKVNVDEKGVRKYKRRIDPIGGMDFIWNTPFYLDPNNQNRMYLAGGKILWRNNDLSAIEIFESKDSISTNWDSLNIPSAKIGENDITALRISKNPANILYFGTSNGRIFRIDSANIGNPIPVELTSSNMPKNANISSICIDPDDANKVLISFSNYSVLSLFYSEDGGKTWNNVSGNLEERTDGGGAGPACQWVEILKTGNKRLYFTGTSAGLFVTSDLRPNGTIWQQEAENIIGNSVVEMLDVRHSDSYLVAATHGIGVYTTNYTSIPSAPNRPILAEPLNQKGGILDRTTLKWNSNPNAVLYNIEISEDSEFKNIFKKINNLNKNFVDVIELVQGYKEYFWRVNAVNAFGESEYSDIWSFKTAPLAPEVSNPKDKATDQPKDINFSWQNVDGASSYHFVLGTNFGYTIKLADTIINANNININNLESLKKYYWKLASVDKNGEGLFGKSVTFTIGNYTSVEESNSSSELNIYPNPNTEQAVISFNLNENSNVLIQIYDIKGNFLEEIINQQLTKGNQRLILNASKYINGSYYVNVFINSQKFVYPITIVR